MTPQRVAALLAPLGARVVGTFTEVREHVPLPTAEAARDAAAAAGADLLLAIGGGSTVGAAKAVAMTARLPIVAVPTTYAGSEITPIWGLTEEGRKKTGVDPAVLPRVVIYDPTLTATLPPDLAAASGFNALAHAVEAMWAPARNPVSTAVAAEAVERLAAGLRAGGDRRRPGRAALRGVAGLVRVRGGGVGAAPQALPRARRHVRPAARPHARRRAAARAGVQRARRAGRGEPGGPRARRRRRGRGLRALADAHGIPRGLQALGMSEAAVEEAAALTAPAVPADNPVPVADGRCCGSSARRGAARTTSENGDSPS